MKRENYIIKSTQLNFYHWAFCVNKNKKQVGKIWEKWQQRIMNTV